MSAKGIQAYPNNSYDTELELPASNDAVEEKRASPSNRAGGQHSQASVHSRHDAPDPLQHALDQSRLMERKSQSPIRGTGVKVHATAQKKAMSIGDMSVHNLVQANDIAQAHAQSQDGTQAHAAIKSRPTMLDIQIDPELLDANTTPDAEGVDIDVHGKQPSELNAALKISLPLAAEEAKRKIASLTSMVIPYTTSPTEWQNRPAFPTHVAPPAEFPAIPPSETRLTDTAEQYHSRQDTHSQKWVIDTSVPPISAPPSASSESPATPSGYGFSGFSPTGTSFDMSRQSSTSDIPEYGSRGSKRRSNSPGSEYNPSQPGKEDGGVPPPKKKSHARKQPAGHIKRARNAFILFRKHVTDSGLIPPSVEVKHQNISVVAAKMWREAPQEVRQKFQEQARIEKEEHQRLYPGYRYQPVFRRTDIIRRRVRKDPAEDEKVEAVAEALIKGKAGDELEKEIKEQMAQRSEASESEAEGSRSSGPRRRRRDAGQLSKGALRAQKAQNRAKQMRQNLLGSSLLNMSMYNAHAQQQRSGQHQSHLHGHGHSHPGMQYAMAESYVPIGYDLNGRPVMDGGYPAQAGYAQEMYGDDMYRLPPIMGYEGQPMGWEGDAGAEYYQTRVAGMAEDYLHAEGADMAGFAMEGGVGELDLGLDYHLPSLLDPEQLDVGLAVGGAGAGPSGPRPADIIAGQYARDGALPDDDKGEDPRMRNWVPEAQQTPSGHVIFNERLFDGALGSAGLGIGEGHDEGLGAFDEAVQQAHDMTAW